MTAPIEGKFELGTDGPNVVLVGLDGSRTSWRATAWAAGLARRQHSKLVVVHVQKPSASAAMAPGLAGAMTHGGREVAEELQDYILSRAPRSTYRSSSCPWWATPGPS